MTAEQARTRRLIPTCLLVLGAIAAVAAATPGSGNGQLGSGELTVQPTIGLPASDVHLIGAASAGSPGEVWAYGKAPRQPSVAQGDTIPAAGLVLLRHTNQRGWSIADTARDEAGTPFPDFTVFSGPGAGRTTPGGGVALVGRAAGNIELLVRNPNGAQMRAVPEPDPGVLEPGETLAEGNQLAFAAVEENERTGVFVGPMAGTGAGDQIDGVAHWDGNQWSREPIEIPGAITGTVRIVALAAASAQRAWLLATAPGRGLFLFRRQADATPRWVEQSLGSTALAKSSDGGLQVSGVQPLRYPAEPLTATEDGVWLDGSLVRSGQKYVFTGFAPAGGGAFTAWCDLPAPTPCSGSLGASLSDPSPGYRSFAWADSGFGTRVITNGWRALGSGGQGGNLGTYLVFDGSEFQRMPAAGTSASASRFAAGAFSSPEEGWIGGDRELLHVSRSPDAKRVEPLPVPFRRPLLDAAGEPGRVPGSDGAQAVAVGDNGAIARYVPGSGWLPEFLVNSNGTRATPRLRGVAWPEPGRAYAVGDFGAMWVWQAATGLWERDDAVPLEFDGNLMDVGFAPGSDSRGYAVGRRGVLLRYGKSWQQEPLPASLAQADFSQITFAGSQSIVAAGDRLAVNDGNGWRVDDQATNLIAATGGTVFAVGGLPDGGAIAAGYNTVLVRDSSGSPWRYSEQPLVDMTALSASAVREGGKVRALVSATPDRYPLPDPTVVEVPGQPPPIFPAFGLPEKGFVLRETEFGWRDEQHEAFREDPAAADHPVQPDPVFALLMSAGGSGWAVGGNTGERFSEAGRRLARTASIARYPATGAPTPGSSVAPVGLGGGVARFAVGGHAQCETRCSDLSLVDIRPDVGLRDALSLASSLAGKTGPRAFLYTGGRLAQGSAAIDFREADRYARLASGSSVPFFPAFGAGDIGSGPAGSQPVRNAFSGFAAPFGQGAAPGGIGHSSVPGAVAAAGAATHYAFDSGGEGGTVRVVVIDNSRGSLAASDPHQNPPEPQEAWLRSVLGDARTRGIPTIVVGNRDLNSRAGSPNVATDADAVARLLVEEGASAYFFDRPEQNRAYPIPAGASETIPSFGTGTLGYFPDVVTQFEFYSESGFLLTELDVSKRDPSSNRVPVNVRLVPLMSQLALDATDGLLLRRSRPALFLGLGRRPEAGQRNPGQDSPEDPYVSFPPNPCVRAGCNTRIEPEFEFSSSDPTVGDFVRRDPATSNLRDVFLGPDDKPVSDSRSGLFCPFNAGTTTVTVRSGGLAFSQNVTVQPGSVLRPCGTRPLAPQPARASGSHQPNLPATPASSPGSPPQPQLPVFPQAVAPAPPPARPTPIVDPFTPLPPQDPYLPVVTPVPSYVIPRPTPPSMIGGARFEEEREKEPAYEDLLNSSSYQQQRDPSFPAGYLLGMAVLAAIAGSSLIRPRRRPMPARALLDRPVRERRRH